MDILGVVVSSHEDGLLNITRQLNQVTSVVSRIAEDESVFGMMVINNIGTYLQCLKLVWPGEAVLSSMNMGSRGNDYAREYRKLGDIASHAIRNIDPDNDVTVLRVKTRKFEVLSTPRGDFNIIVVQSDRRSRKK